MKTSTTGRVLVAFAFASMIGGLTVGTSLGDDNDWRQAQQNRREQVRREQVHREEVRREEVRREQERREHERASRENRVWHDKGGWRDNRGVWHAYQPVYVPPPVVYAPAPSPGIHFFFPFFR
jgi:hypothetical protein